MQRTRSSLTALPAGLAAMPTAEPMALLPGDVSADLLARLADSHHTPIAAEVVQKEEAPGTGTIPRASVR
ncbi:MAG TPA: hypothetical protein DEP35_23020 [Deltaproteobacteria bacterium]|nr:hypothetical protein [Deltaproteobacteria bacterium]